MGSRRGIAAVATGGLSELTGQGRRMGGVGRSVKELTEKRRTALTRSINEDRTISDETRRELMETVASGNLSQLKRAGSRFKRAISGNDPLFKSRQILQEQRNIARDRPGRRQTLASSFASRGSSGTIGGGE